MSQDINFMIPGGGGGGAPSGAAGGDLGGTYPNPTVAGAHFGGVDGQYMIRRSGLWAPAAPAYADLTGTPTALPPNGSAGGDLGGTYPNPTVTAARTLTNGAQSLTLNTDGTLAAVASAATLGALQTNVASQFVSGNNTRGYVRVTVSATPVTAGVTIAIVQFSAALSARAYILVTPAVMANAQYGDTVAPINAVTGPAFAQQGQAAQTVPSSFSIQCAAGLVANNIYAFFYWVLE